MIRKTDPHFLFYASDDQIVRRGFVDTLQAFVGIAILVVFGTCIWAYVLPL